MTAAALSALCRDLGLGPDPDAVLGTLREIYEDIDARVAAAAHDVSLPCKKGCDACCHEAVFLSAPEFLGVAQDILTWPTERRASVVGQMLRFAELFEDELEQLDIFEAGPERDEVARRVKFRCPLLDSDGTCGVYAWRELNGRTFGQSWDERREHAYGCQLTHDRLRVIGEPAPALFGARRARALLADRFPDHDVVHVYPWWFARHAAHFEEITLP